MKIPTYKIILAVFDFLIIRLSFSFALQLDGVSNVKGVLWRYYVTSPEFLAFFVVTFIVLVIFQSRDLYKLHVIFNRLRHNVAIFVCIAYTVVVLSVIAFFIRSPWIIDGRLAVSYFAVISFIGVAAFRNFIFLPLFILLNKTAVIKKNVIIIGSGIPARSFAVEMGIGNIYGFNLIGFVSDDRPAGSHLIERYNVLGPVRDIPGIVEQYDVKEIIVAESGDDYNNLLTIIDLCRQTRAHINIASPLFEVVHKKYAVDSYFDLPIVPIKGIDDSQYIWKLKRAMDIGGAAIGIVLFSIPLVIIALAIKFTSHGPILYKQVRIGKNGKPFDFYKFRSMKVGSDIDQDRIDRMKRYIKGEGSYGVGSSKVVNEMMVTKVGAFLRKTSLDELPQLINVLKGEMSLVGPRPCLPYEFEAYDDWHKRRLSVLPGCTGLWQVSSRSEGDFDEMVVLDLYYIGNISPAFDIQLIFKTIPVMIFGRGGK